MRKVLIYGSGGHAKVVINAVENENKYTIAGLIDDENPQGQSVLGYEIIGSGRTLPELFNKSIRSCIVAIGDNAVRKLKTEYILKIGFELITVTHPFSSIGKDVIIGKGAVVFGGVVIDPSVSIGRGVIVNDKALVGHDSIIEDFAHISAGALVGGKCFVGENSFIGMGAVIISNVKVGKNVFVGSGSVVTKDIQSNTKAMGIPARTIGSYM